MSSGIDALTAAQSIIWGGGRRGTDGHLKFWDGDGRGAGGLVTQVLICGWNAGWRDAYVQFIICRGGGGRDACRLVTQILTCGWNAGWRDAYVQFIIWGGGGRGVDSL